MWRRELSLLWESHQSLRRPTRRSKFFSSCFLKEIRVHKSRQDLISTTLSLLEMYGYKSSPMWADFCPCNALKVKTRVFKWSLRLMVSLCMWYVRPVYVICEKSYKLEALQEHSEQPADVPGSVKTSKCWIIIFQTQLNKGVNIFQFRAWHSGTRITTGASNLFPFHIFLPVYNNIASFPPLRLFLPF